MNRKGTCEPYSCPENSGMLYTHHCHVCFSFMAVVCMHKPLQMQVHTDRSSNQVVLVSFFSFDRGRGFLDLYLLKSDSVKLSILSPVLVLQQCHPNKLQGCRKNRTRVVSIATPTRELRLCSALLPLQLSVQKAVITEFCESYWSSHSTVLWVKFSEKMYLPRNILSFLTVKGQTVIENTQTLLKYWFDQVLGKQQTHLRSGLTWITGELRLKHKIEEMLPSAKATLSYFSMAKGMTVDFGEKWSFYTSFEPSHGEICKQMMWQTKQNDVAKPVCMHLHLVPS